MPTVVVPSNFTTKEGLSSATEALTGEASIDIDGNRVVDGADATDDATDAATFDSASRREMLSRTIIGAYVNIRTNHTKGGGMHHPKCGPTIHTVVDIHIFFVLPYT